MMAVVVMFFVVYWWRLLIVSVVPRFLDGMVRVVVETLVVVCMLVPNVWGFVVRGSGLMMGWRGRSVQ